MRLSDARGGDEILAALANFIWYERHQRPAPSNFVPSVGDLVGWLGQQRPRPPGGTGWGGLSVGEDLLLVHADLTEVTPGKRRKSVSALECVHHDWLAAGAAEAHPAESLVREWQESRAAGRDAALVTAANGAFIRRPVTLSLVARIGWQDDGELPAAIVDGEAVAVPVPDLGAWVTEQQRQRKRRKFRPGEQVPLKLPGVPPIAPDLRLAALGGLPPVIAGDVGTLVEVAHAVNWPGVLLSEKEGAALLARTRDGGYRRPLPGDIERFRVALAEVHGLIAWFRDRYGLNWRPMATVEPQPGGQTWRLSPPEWMRGGPSERWTLSAAGGAVARARVGLEADGSPAGRMITGLEYRLAARWDGRPGIAPDLRPERRGGPGPVVFVPWRDVLRYAGIAWDEADPRADHAARKQYRRAVDRIARGGYMVTHLGRETTAGDSIELTGIQTGGGKGRAAGLWVRASRRLVEAARLASLGKGKGFSGVRLVDWMGLSKRK